MEGSDSAASQPEVRTTREIQHMPRTRAKPPMVSDPEYTRDEKRASTSRPASVPNAAAPVQLSREQVSHAYDILEQQRVGPYAMKYGLLGSAGLIAYTYLTGFFHLYQKDKQAWMGTFRQRIFIVGPVLAAYATANDLLPLPFKARLEEMLGRKAISMQDIITAKRVVKLSQELPLSAQV